MSKHERPRRIGGGVFLSQNCFSMGVRYSNVSSFNSLLSCQKLIVGFFLDYINMPLEEKVLKKLLIFNIFFILTYF